MSVPFLDLAIQYRALKTEIDAAVQRVLDSTQFVLGDAVAQFEADFAAYIGAEQAIGLNSGTSALHLALLALGVRPGDEVITVPHTFVATAAAAMYIGAHPVFVDVEPDRYTMDPTKLEAAITPKTKAIVPVHIYGQCADMDPILEIASRRGIPVVEDAAQAHGAQYKGRSAGSMGSIGCFSFYPGKNLGAYGEGGACITNDRELARKIRAMRDWGQEKKGVHSLPGFNFRMEGMQGAILGVKLPYLRKWTLARQAHAMTYLAGLRGRVEKHGVILPKIFETAGHVFHIFAILHPERDKLRDRLQKSGISTGVHYTTAVHLQPAYRAIGKAGDFPIAESIAARTLSLPMYPELSASQIQTVCSTIVALLEVPA